MEKTGKVFIPLVIVAGLLLIVSFFLWNCCSYPIVIDLPVDEFPKGDVTKLFQDSNFFVWPEVFDLKLEENTRVGIVAVITNDAYDGENHEFVINVYAADTPEDVKNNHVNDWLSFRRASKEVEIAEQQQREIKILVPKEAKKGNYFFEIIACWNVNGSSVVSETCTENSSNLWNKPLDFILTIE